MSYRPDPTAVHRAARRASQEPAGLARWARAYVACLDASPDSLAIAEANLDAVQRTMPSSLRIAADTLVGLDEDWRRRRVSTPR